MGEKTDVFSSNFVTSTSRATGATRAEHAIYYEVYCLSFVSSITFISSSFKFDPEILLYLGHEVNEDNYFKFLSWLLSSIFNIVRFPAQLAQYATKGWNPVCAYLMASFSRPLLRVKVFMRKFCLCRIFSLCRIFC
jgi:hypothetical protein